MQRKLDEIAWGREEGARLVGDVSRRDLLVAGAALYADEGSKTDGSVLFANSSPEMQRMFLLWLRTFFDIDESRLRLRLYLHESLDFEVASAFWEEVTGIPRSQHTLPYRAEENPSIRKVKHPMGCPRVVYSCAATHRLVMGMVAALLSCNLLPG